MLFRSVSQSRYANVLSQVELNKATAKKTEAEAEKIAGADTKVAESEAEMLKSQSEFNKRVTKLQDSIEKLFEWMKKEYGEDLFWAYVGINSQSLNSFWLLLY